MEQKWKVGELARLTGLTIRTLRYYDQIGLYSPSGYSESGHRLYTEADIARLQQILSLKELGLSLEEIKSVMAGERFSLPDIIAMQISRIKKNLAIEQKLLRELEHISRLMARKETLQVEDFTKLLGTMRLSHEKFVAEKRAAWKANLDRLGEHLDKHPEP